MDAFGKAKEGIKEIGKSIVRGLWDGISSMVSWIMEKVSGFVGGIVDGAKNLLGIHSPSKVFAEIGGYMAEGMAQGIDATAKTAVQAAGAMAKAVTSAAVPSVGLSGMGNAMRARLESINSAQTLSSRIRSLPPITDFKIPAIAQGSVIPANREFASAMRGSSGIDMEALSATVSTAVKNAMGGNENSRILNDILSAVKAGHVITVDGRTFGRVSVDCINDVVCNCGKKLKV